MATGETIYIGVNILPRKGEMPGILAVSDYGESASSIRPTRPRRNRCWTYALGLPRRRPTPSI